MPFPGRDLEEENKALRAEIELLRKVLASNGLTSASALTHRHNSDLPAVPKQPEDRQERAEQRIVLFESCFMVAKMSNVANKTRSLTRLSRSCDLQWVQVSQWTIEMKMCNRCARLARSSIFE